MQFLHTMIRTNKEEEMLRFYCDFLGLKKGKRIRLDDCYLQYLTDEKTGVELELTINDEKQEYKSGEKFGHFAFLCENLDEINKKMEEFGYSWDKNPFYLKEVKTRISFLFDPDGNVVELIEQVN